MSGTSARLRSNSPHLPPRSAPARWSAAVLAAAALVFLPVVAMLFGAHGPDGRNESIVVWALGSVALAALAFHIWVSERPGEALAVEILAGALNAAAVFGVFLLVIVGGSCSDDGHVPPGAWLGALALYLGGAAWALQRGWRAVLLVPLTVVAGGAWLVAVSVLFTGSTGACLD